jgi:glutaredoxin
MFLRMFVLQGCPYCENAIKLAQDRGINTEIIVVNPNEKYIFKAMNKMDSFPQIFVVNEDNGETTKIGGYQDLALKI